MQDLATWKVLPVKTFNSTSKQTVTEALYKLLQITSTNNSVVVQLVLTKLALTQSALTITLTDRH